MSKDIAILKIIIWSIIALFATCLFFFLIVFDKFLEDDLFNVEGKVETVRTTEVDVENINDISMKFIYGKVSISSYDGDKIIIEEKSNKKLDEDKLFKITDSSGELKIEQPRVIILFNFFGFGRESRVTEIRLPRKQYNNIKVEMTSGKFDASDINANDMYLKMTSGDTYITGTTAKYLTTKMTSGDIDISGAFEKIDSKSTSGSLDINTSIVPSHLIVDITSGRAEIAIPENDGFTLNIDKTSGKVESEFELDQYDKYKNGSRNYMIKMTSGSVKISKR